MFDKMCTTSHYSLPFLIFVAVLQWACLFCSCKLPYEAIQTNPHNQTNYRTAQQEQTMYVDLTPGYNLQVRRLCGSSFKALAKNVIVLFNGITS